jgi:hypothetical protein
VGQGEVSKNRFRRSARGSGIIGSIIACSDAHVLRLSMIYAVKKNLSKPLKKRAVSVAMSAAAEEADSAQIFAVREQAARVLQVPQSRLIFVKLVHVQVRHGTNKMLEGKHHEA